MIKRIDDYKIVNITNKTGMRLQSLSIFINVLLIIIIN